MTTPGDPHAEHVRKTIDHVLAQREEILAAFIAKHGFHPDQAIQIEQRQADGSTTWRIEKRPALMPVATDCLNTNHWRKLMTDTPNRPPLWEVMSDACADHPRGVVDLHSAAVAAEIRALRDHIFLGGRPDPVGVSPDCLAIWDELTAEADRAERGHHG